MRFKRGPLGPGLVKRNLAHLQGYLQRSRIDDFPWQALLAAYQQASATAAKA
ncbi:hypothetical protein D3C81_1613310 [compost metagenome]